MDCNRFQASGMSHILDDVSLLVLQIPTDVEMYPKQFTHRCSSLSIIFEKAFVSLNCQFLVSSCCLIEHIFYQSERRQAPINIKSKLPYIYEYTIGSLTYFMGTANFISQILLVDTHRLDVLV